MKLHYIKSTLITNALVDRFLAKDMLKIEVISDDKKIKEIVNDLLENKINIKQNLPIWIDSIKLGDSFVLLQIDKDQGIYNTLHLPAGEVQITQGLNGDPYYLRYFWTTKNMHFEDWQVARFSMQKSLTSNFSYSSFREGVWNNVSRIVRIHLYLLGYKDKLDNFTLSSNNTTTK